jgi:hypothetical protein
MALIDDFQKGLKFSISDRTVEVFVEHSKSHRKVYGTFMETPGGFPIEQVLQYPVIVGSTFITILRDDLV